MDLREELTVKASAFIGRLQADRVENVRKLQQTLERSLAGALKEIETAASAPMNLDAEIGALTGAVETLIQARVDAAAGERTTLEREIESLRRALEASRAECAALEAATTDAGSLRQELLIAQAEAQAASAESQQLRTALEEAETSYERAEAAWLQAALMPLELQLDAAKRLATATTVADVLAVVVDTLAQDLGRAALFSVKDGRLEGVRQVGFELASDISKLVVPLGLDSVLSDAVSSGRVQGLLGPGLSAGTRALFGGSPNFALVVPVVVKGEPLAVVYADDSDQTTSTLIAPEQRMQLAELLLCQIVPRLPKLLRAERAIAGLANHASQLLTRIEQGYAGDRQKDVPAAKLQARIEKNLAEARDIYEQAAGPSSEAAAIFESQLAATIRLHAGTPFGRDLAAAAGGASDSKKSSGFQASASRA